MTCRSPEPLNVLAAAYAEIGDFPADVLGFEMLDVELLLESCVLARAGATIQATLGGLPFAVTADTVNAVEPQLRQRREVPEKAIRRRGFAALPEGYTATRKGDCDSWLIGDARVLVEQDGYHARFSQGGVRHRAIVVESAVVLMHDSNTDLRIPCEIADGTLTFVTPTTGGVSGMATGPVRGGAAVSRAGRTLTKRRCRWGRQAAGGW